MAFRHGNHGQVPGAHRGAVWTCPSCGNEVTSPLEGGCPFCKAGRDAKQATQAPATPPTGASAGFTAWMGTVEHLQTPAQWSLLEEAFLAGARWKEQQMQGQHQGLEVTPSLIASVVKPPAAPDPGGYTMALVNPLGVEIVCDPRTQPTILAALQFYVENTLAYGDMPGQLTAQEARGLIAQLQPKEKEEVPS